MKISKWDQSDQSSTQSKIIGAALAAPDQSLDVLLGLMRQTGQTAVYLSGSRLDNDYCFGSSDVGLLLSVLPEDGIKAAKPGYHPESTETYITFQGSLVMECLEAGKVNCVTVCANKPLVLPPGRCHRVRHDDKQPAASLIAKTNLNHQPGVVRCDACHYYTEKTECLLHRSWMEEMRPRVPNGEH